MPAQPGHVPLSQYTGGGGYAGLARAEPDEKTIDDHLAVQAIIRSYQVSSLLAEQGREFSSARDSRTVAGAHTKEGVWYGNTPTLIITVIVNELI